MPASLYHWSQHRLQTHQDRGGGEVRAETGTSLGMVTGTGERPGWGWTLPYCLGEPLWGLLGGSFGCSMGYRDSNLHPTPTPKIPPRVCELARSPIVLAWPRAPTATWHRASRSHHPHWAAQEAEGISPSGPCESCETSWSFMSPFKLSWAPWVHKPSEFLPPHRGDLEGLGRCWSVVALECSGRVSTESRLFF